MSDQLSLFAGAMRAPAVADLQGLLAGPGQAVRQRGVARISVIVTEPWRAVALLSEFAARDLAGDQGPADAAVDNARVVDPKADTDLTAGGDSAGIVVGTEFTAVLAPIASQWLHGAVKRPPRGFVLDETSLRLWTIAAGVRVGAGFLLRLGLGDEPAWPAIGSALAAAGLPATFVGVRADGPGYRITSRRRLTRLAELVGEPPSGATNWP